MAVDRGTRFGLYEVTGTLGAGGMGEVYRATDTKLGREVAIKTLPATLAGDADRLARFEREARLLAALNHPHIAAVFGLDEHEGTLFLAMELVEGETLETRLKSGALTVEDALRLALQVTEALEAAHGRGVVHRDLKPANIMLTNEGQVKVLDFGLAKAFAGASGEASPMHSPALSLAMTQQGLVLGTAGYMSPEQASGQGIDQRADIWSFGVVLYEMLTGLPLFRGESVPHILADVLKTEPDWSRLPPELHPRIRLLLEHCLTKKPHSRLHSIADARIEIEAVIAAPEGVLPGAVTADARQTGARRWRLVGGVAGIAAAALLTGWFLRPLPATTPGPVGRFSILLGPEQQLTAAPLTMVAISPDGTRIAYAADRQIYLRNLDELDARAIPRTQMPGQFGATLPAFSPDGEWMAFVDAPGPNGPFSIMRLPSSGGAPVRLYQVEGTVNFPHGLSWPTADTLLFADDAGIVRMSATGGDPELLVPRGADERLYSPQLLPDGESVLFVRTPPTPTLGADVAAAEIMVQSIGSDDRTLIRKGGTDPRYLSTGHLIYAEGATLFAIPFDPMTRTTNGGPVPLVEGLLRASNGFSDTAHYAVSASGTLVYMPDRAGGGAAAAPLRTTLSWVDREGREEPLSIPPDDYTTVRVSPDGSKAALVVSEASIRAVPPTIWIYDLQTTNMRLLTTEPASQDGPVWSADGGSLYFRSPGEAAFNVHVVDLETGDVALVASGTADGFPFPMPWSVSASGNVLALVNGLTEDDIDIATVALPSGEPTRALSAEGLQNEPTISPDGAWLAYYEGPPGGPFEIRIRPFPALGRTVIPVSPGQFPVFSGNGSELYFFDGEGIAAAAVAFEPGFRVDTPRRLFTMDGFLPSVRGRSWDPAPDGTRFLMIRDPGSIVATDSGDTAPQRVDVVLNWFEELKRRVPIASIDE